LDASRLGDRRARLVEVPERHGVHGDVHIPKVIRRPRCDQPMGGLERSAHRRPDRPAAS
jgi:hypothetical protein